MINLFIRDKLVSINMSKFLARFYKSIFGRHEHYLLYSIFVSRFRVIENLINIKKVFVPSLLCLVIAYKNKKDLLIVFGFFM